MREALLTKIASIRVPDGPLEIILDHFGVENVAEVTGRTRRVVYKDTKDGRKRIVEPWGKTRVWPMLMLSWLIKRKSLYSPKPAEQGAVITLTIPQKTND